MSGTLYLVPVPIGDGDPLDELPPKTIRLAASVSYFIVENIRSARRFLSKVINQDALDMSAMVELSEHTPEEALAGILAPLRAGTDAALISEAGCPCVADPGFNLVAQAHTLGIRVVPLTGPSSILLAVMASGLGGQRFSFNGYLPADPAGRASALALLEARSAQEGSTELFIETPYRTDAMIKSMGVSLQADSLVCAAVSISTPLESIYSANASRWKKNPPAPGKQPAVFALKASPCSKKLTKKPPAQPHASTRGNN
ncbi:MAG TPA: SAM-dependent methyltransferase [Spirochaetales bacterium]|nr:SAM-dependent methyltransferase [Spirochaetales bacterium]